MAGSARRIIAIIIILFLSYGCNLFEDDDLPQNVVRIRDNSYDPPTIEIRVGQTIEWRHEGSNPHTVTSGTPTSNQGAIFESGVLNNGAVYLFTFPAAGDYSYFCRFHGTSMTGLVRVR